MIRISSEGIALSIIEGYFGPNNQVRILYASGARYTGNYRDGMRTGKGIFTAANGERYEGEWLSDKKSGLGT
jgi:hypothetical protein